MPGLFGSSKKAEAKAKANATNAKGKGKGAPASNSRSASPQNARGQPTQSKGAGGKGAPAQSVHSSQPSPQEQQRAAFQREVQQFYAHLQDLKQFITQPYDDEVSAVLDTVMGEAGAQLQALQDQMERLGINDPGCERVIHEFLEFVTRVDEWKRSGQHAHTGSQARAAQQSGQQTGQQHRTDSRTESNTDGSYEEEEEEEEESDDEELEGMDEDMRRAIKESKAMEKAMEVARRADEEEARKLEHAQRQQAADAHRREQEQEAHARKLAAEAEQAKRAAAEAARAASREHDERKRQEALAEQERQERLQRQKEAEEKAAERSAAAWHAEEIRHDQSAANIAHEEHMRRQQQNQEQVLQEQMVVMQRISAEEEEARRLREEAEEAQRKGQADVQRQKQELANQKARHAREEAAKHAAQEEAHAKQLEKEAKEAERRAERAARAAARETDEAKRSLDIAEQHRQLEEATQLHAQASEEMAHAQMLHQHERGGASSGRENHETDDVHRQEAEMMLRETLQAASVQNYELVEFAVNEAKHKKVANKQLIREGEKKLAQMKKGFFLKTLQDLTKDPNIDHETLEQHIRTAAEAGISAGDLAPFQSKLKKVAEKEKCKQNLAQALQSADPMRIKQAIATAKKAGVEAEEVHQAEIAAKACQFLFDRGDSKKRLQLVFRSWRDIRTETRSLKQQLVDVEKNGADAIEIDRVLARSAELEVLDYSSTNWDKIDKLQRVADARRLAHDQAVCALVSKDYDELSSAIEALNKAGGPKATIDLVQPELASAEANEKLLVEFDRILPSAVSKFIEARRAALSVESPHSAIDFSAVGSYLVTRQGVTVHKDAEGSSLQVGSLDVGAHVTILEFSPKLEKGRVRARIEQPAGWISTWLANDKDDSFVTRQAASSSDAVLPINDHDSMVSVALGPTVARVPNSNTPGFQSVTGPASSPHKSQEISSRLTGGIGSPQMNGSSETRQQYGIANAGGSMTAQSTQQVGSTQQGYQSSSWFGTGSLLGELMGFDNTTQTTSRISPQDGSLSPRYPSRGAEPSAVQTKQRHQDLKAKVERARLYIHQTDRAHKKAQRDASPPLHPHQHPGKVQTTSPVSSFHSMSPPPSGSMYSPFGSHGSHGPPPGYGGYPPPAPGYAEPYPGHMGGRMTGPPPAPYHRGGMPVGPYGW